MDQVLVSDLKKAVDNIAAPFLLVLPAEDNLVYSERLFKNIRGNANAFKRIEMLSGVKRDALGPNAQNIVADWVKHVASTSVSRPITIKSPMTLRDFNPLEMIGEGTYGKVWLVKHLQSKTYMAMKVQDKSCFTQVYQVNTVVREREILAGLKNSPFLVKYLGAFQDERRLYILMEYIIGGEIMTRMRQVGRFSPEDARFYIGEVLMALKALHEDDIVFRDLKPENVLLDSLGHIRLVDFGSARKVDRKTGRCGSFCGSPFYMAPELLVKGFYDGRQVDFWCFGVLLYEFLVGVPPFRGKTSNSIYARVLHEKPLYPDTLSSDAKDLLRWCLEKNPEKRPASIEAIQKHRWFRGIDWERMGDRLYIPPYQPPFASDEDTGNFFKYSLSPEEYFAEDSLSYKSGPSDAGDGELMQFPGF
jgi:serine/threonine protein kinase